MVVLDITSQSKGRTPVGGFEVLVFIKVRPLRLNSLSGTPLTVTLGYTGYFLL